MNNSDLLRYKNLLLAKQKELTSQSRAGPFAVSVEPRGDPVDMAASESMAATQIRLKQSDSKLLRTIEDALSRIRQERFGIWEGCGTSITRIRLEAVPWARHCKSCKEHDP